MALGKFTTILVHLVDWSKLMLLLLVAIKFPLRLRALFSGWFVHRISCKPADFYQLEGDGLGATSSLRWVAPRDRASPGFTRSILVALVTLPPAQAPACRRQSVETPCRALRSRRGYAADALSSHGVSAAACTVWGPLLLTRIK